jgi:hypothetical protein
MNSFKRLKTLSVYSTFSLTLALTSEGKATERVKEEAESAERRARRLPSFNSCWVAVARKWCVPNTGTVSFVTITVGVPCSYSRGHPV